MAKKNISDIEKGVGFVGGFLPAIMDMLRERNVPFEAMHRLVTAEGRATLAKLVAVIEADWRAGQPAPAAPPKPPEPEPEPTITEYDLTVDYRKTVEQMLKAGEYDGYVDPNITTGNFPVEGTGVVRRKAKLVHFGKDMSDAAVDAWCEARGKRRGTALEQLAIGAAYKSLQREFPIVSGQAAQVSGHRVVVYLSGRGAVRDADLGWTGYGWNRGCRFLVFDE